MNLHFDTILRDGKPLDDRLTRCLAHAGAWLSQVPVSTVTFAVVSELGLDAAEAAELEHAVAGLDHVGFIAPGAPDATVLGAAARAAGFPLGHATAPSRVLAEELGERVGRPRVETLIFRAWREGPGGTSQGVEIFVPEERPEQIDLWVAAGVGTHVALRVPSREALAKVTSTLASRGALSRQFQGGPLDCPDRSTMTYLDLGLREGRPLRVELIAPSG